MLETLSVFQWSILALAALCIGMSKTGVQGMMLLIVPYMAMAFGAKESTGVILPMLCMADIMAVAYQAHSRLESSSKALANSLIRLSRSTFC